MKQFTYTCVFLLFSQFAIGQLIIDDTVTLKKGAYRNIDELKFNSPSLGGKYYIIKQRQNTALLGLDEIFFLYKIYGEYENIYGYCDGKYIYIKSKKPHYYTKILDIGRYCYIQDLFPGNQYSLDYVYSLILNLDNNKRLEFTASSVKKLIKNDHELSSQFKIQKEKNNLLKRDSIWRFYLKEYSNRNKNEVNRIDSSFQYFQSIELYKISTDSSVSAYYSRVLQHKKDTFFLEMNLEKTYHSNGRLKSIGLMARHLKTVDPLHLYRIGTWLFYDRHGELKKQTDYNITTHKKRQHGISKRLE